ncbi:MAG: hypothetical protein ABH820_01250 [Patescibacteria group bacterium]|nr:hypothetical protein [Patescibacteria group bacterium]
MKSDTRIGSEPAEPKTQEQMIADFWNARTDEYKERFDSETKERLDKMTVDVMPDLGFVTVQAKAHLTKDDWESYIIWSESADPRLEALGKKIIANLPDEMKATHIYKNKNFPPGISGIFPQSQQFFERGIRSMISVDHPEDDKKQIVTYAIYNPARDVDGRYADGGSQLVFSIDKDNEYYDLLKQGKLMPREFIIAILHAGVALGPQAKHLFGIIGAGTGDVMLADYSTQTTVSYPGGSAEGQVKTSKDVSGFIQTLEQSGGTGTFSNVPGMSDPWGHHRTQLRSFIEQGNKDVYRDPLPKPPEPPPEPVVEKPVGRPETAVEKATKIIKKRIAEVWKTEDESYKYYREPLDEEKKVKEQIDEVTLGVMPDLDFVNVEGKTHHQDEDFTVYTVCSKSPDLDLGDLGKKAVKALPEGMKEGHPPAVLMPRYQNFVLERGVRPMLILDHPEDQEKQLVSYAICNPTADAAGRASDGGGSLTFSINKDNKYFELLKQGHLAPRVFVEAILHAGVALGPKAKHLLNIFVARSAETILADYSTQTFVNYPPGSAEGEIKTSGDIPKFLQALKQSGDTGELVWIPGFRKERGRDTRELARFIEHGDKDSSRYERLSVKKWGEPSELFSALEVLRSEEQKKKPPEPPPKPAVEKRVEPLVPVRPPAPVPERRPLPPPRVPPPKPPAPVIKPEPVEAKVESKKEQVFEQILKHGGFRFSAFLPKEELSPIAVAGDSAISYRMREVKPSRDESQHTKDVIEWQLVSETDKRIGLDLGKLMEKQGLHELIDIRMVKKPVYEQVTIPGKKGFMGIGKTPDRQEPKFTGQYKNVMHDQAVENGKPEAAIRFTYYIPQQPDWRTYDGRHGQYMTAEFVLPDSVARGLLDEINEDPSVMRELVGRMLKEKLLNDPEAWDKAKYGRFPGDEPTPNATLRPPYEKWDAEPGGRRIYVQKARERGGFRQDLVKKF